MYEEFGGGGIMAYTAIDDPEAYFQVKIYTGSGSAASHTLDGDTDMQPDMIWFKQRSSTAGHALFDDIRGVNNYLQPHTNDPSASATEELTAFGSDGFSLGDSSDGNFTNRDTYTYVAWCWKESATAGFDMVAFTGNGTGNTAISHSLSAIPKMIITKHRTSTENWIVYFKDTVTRTGFLSLANAFSTPASTGFYGTSAHTSSVYYIGDDTSVNTNTETYISYLFADVQGFSRFGRYTGNANADGPFIYTGFRPAFVMLKQATDGSTPWMIFDNKRDTFNETGQLLYPDVNNAEADDANPIDILSNGFKLRTSGSYNNGSGKVVTYTCFAEAPFVNSNGVPCNAR